MDKRKKYGVYLLIELVFSVMLAFNLSINKMDFGDDAFFLKQFMEDFNSNYIDF